MSNFTPGPWEVFIYDWGLNPYKNLLGDYAIKRKPEEPLIAYALNLADARLIAAAPEMVKKLDQASCLLHDASTLDWPGAQASKAIADGIDALLRRIEGDEDKETDG